LELLKDDTSKYVRKSVANNINDISKDHPDIVIDLTKKWIDKNKECDALLKHGCRTLLKNSNQEALKLFGFFCVENVTVKDFTISKNVNLGEELSFSFDLQAPSSLGKLRIEFALHFLRKNNQHNKKVFKISEGFVQERHKKITKIYSFKKISTRVYYTGIQKISIIINGEVFITDDFMLH